MTVRAFRDLTLDKSTPTWVFYEGTDSIKAQAEGRFIECEEPVVAEA